MRKLLLSLSVALCGLSAAAQTVADFESPVLPKSDTFYLDYSKPMADVGFNSGLAHFPAFYDTSFGGYWVNGFSYSNMKDSVTSGYLNQYAAKTAQGFAGSAQYAVCYGSYNILPLTGAARGHKVAGFYLTNSTYAYNSMRDGDFFAKKFGGTSGSDTDWCKLDVYGFKGGVLGTTPVTTYLADFRDANPANDYILKDWVWVNLLPLGDVDSLQFLLSSSDTSGGYMNTPAYFCMDNFMTNETGTAIGETPAAGIAKIYPNPAQEMLFVEASDKNLVSIGVTDMTGRVIAQYPVQDQKTAIPTGALVPGTYILTLTNADQRTSTARFIKQ
jgi:hypothetical protein